MGIDWKALLGKTAPAIATALGGPLAGTATQLLATKLLGKSTATEPELAAAIAGATPEQLIELKKLDNDFRQSVMAQATRLEEIDAGDRASARARQIAMHDWTPNVIAIGVMLCYFLIQWHVLTHSLPKENSDIILRTLGTLDAIVTTVVMFIFGSSRSSRAKDESIRQAAAAGK